MYYIVNKKNNIIAVDDSLLKLLNLNSIDELQEKIILNKINFDYSSENNIKIALESDIKTYNIAKHNLSCIVGDITLIEVRKPKSIIEEIKEEKKQNENSLGILPDTNIEKAPLLKDISQELLLNDDSDDLLVEKDIPKQEEPIGLSFDNGDNELSLDLGIDDSDDLLVEKALSEQTEQEEPIGLSLDDSDDELSLDLGTDNSDDLLVEKALSEQTEQEEPIGLSLDDSEEDTIEEIVKTQNDFLDFDSDKLFDLDEDKPEDESENKVEELSFDNDDLFDIMSDDLVEENIKTEEKSQDSIEPIEEDDLFNIMSDETAEIVPKEVIADENNSDDLFDIMSEDTIEEPTKVEEPITTKVLDIIPLVVDKAVASQEIGISEDDYTTFLNEYIETATALEDDLKSSEVSKRDSAIDTLTHLSDVLHLSPVKSILENLRGANANISGQFVTQLHSTLANITFVPAKEAEVQPTVETIQEPTPTVVTTPEPTIEAEVQPTIVQTPEIEITPEIVEEPPVLEEEPKGFGTIDLSDVQPIHFDFQLEAAASELSLPVELIEEFVVDFIEQAHEETDKMLEAYTKGDLDAIQKLGHLLKGTSSNLRINPLADTLYKIQFCEDSSQLEDLIKDYWAHFISFEKKISLITK